MGLCRRRRPMAAWAPSGRLDRPSGTELCVRKVARYHQQESPPEVGSTHASVGDVPGQTVKHGLTTPRDSLCPISNGWASFPLGIRRARDRKPISRRSGRKRTKTTEPGWLTRLSIVELVRPIFFRWPTQHVEIAELLP